MKEMEQKFLANGRQYIFAAVFAVPFFFTALCGIAAEGSPLTAAAPPAAKAEKIDKSYQLQTGDRVNIKIYPEDEYIKGGEIEVSVDGHVTLPLLGKIQVLNKSVVEAEKIITEMLAKDYLVNPQVAIEVLQYQKNSFVVLGQVQKPGTYTFPPGHREMPLLQAISMAGGFSEIANIKKIMIMRKSTGEVIQANAEAIINGQAAEVSINPDDVVHVKESLF